MDWDIEAQQLLRMCQAIRAVQFLKKYLTTSWLLFHSYSTNVCAWLQYTGLCYVWSERTAG